MIANFIKTVIRLTAILGLTALTAISARAQDYPSKPITFVVGFSAGGFADSVGRILAQGVSDQLGQPVVVENRGGAAGNVAAGSVAASAGDGYTVLVTTASLGLSQSTRKELPYDIKDLTAVAIPASSPETLAAHPSVPANNLAELIAWAKTQPSVTLGNAGIGTGSQVTTAFFLTKLAGLDNIKQIGYKGGSKARQAAISGEVQLIGSSNSVYPVIREGLLKGLAVASVNQHDAIPNVETFEEQGYDRFVVSSWVGLFVPSNTPADIQEKLNLAVNEMLQQTETQEKFKKAGVLTHERDLNASKQFFATDTKNWSNMVYALGIGN
ncbi:Bug family tripartite tricarboxylate transporter substrate binding protein [Roseibium marinum]|uniref:Tripartite-type tricarboxylate transporter receptor subunit TctC n=1 Tax=Roseibium marinum TaxID=281252 RepID=A0A2S3UK89_9HYPH|nr:tripartite tricarboxylate transporter substrate binding protein [Roseibium marinum]POF27919.1 tripartite-type tricarboxylate transporter receptor subunit TctC [Roseibium marinum]